MANAYIGLTELAKFNDCSIADYGISDVFNKSPFIKKMAAVKATGVTSHSYLRETAAPVAEFRALNTGKENGVGTFAKVDIVLKLLDASTIVDVGAVKGSTPERVIARYAESALQQAFFELEKQVIYGTGNDADGFAGLSDNAGYNGLADGLVVNAGGTTANTGSSVWLISSTPDEKGVSVVLGNDGVIDIGESVVSIKADDSDVSKSYGAYYTPIMAWAGMSLGSTYSAVRIANLTADSGKGLTDALIFQALSLFPSGTTPNMLVMNRRSLAQLQKSRTAVNVTGAPAPIPSEVAGIEIVVTDAIKNTEALLA